MDEMLLTDQIPTVSFAAEDSITTVAVPDIKYNINCSIVSAAAPAGLVPEISWTTNGVQALNATVAELYALCLSVTNNVSYNISMDKVPKHIQRQVHPTADTDAPQELESYLHFRQAHSYHLQFNRWATDNSGAFCESLLQMLNDFYSRELSIFGKKMMRHRCCYILRSIPTKIKADLTGSTELGSVMTPPAFFTALSNLDGIQLIDEVEGSISASLPQKWLRFRSLMDLNAAMRPLGLRISVEARMVPIISLRPIRH